MLADFGATVILACRDLAKGEAAAQEIKKRLCVLASRIRLVRSLWLAVRRPRSAAGSSTCLRWTRFARSRRSISPPATASMCCAPSHHAAHCLHP